MKKISSFITFVCILNALTILGLAGFLLGTGRLDKPEALAIADILRAHATPEDFRVKVYEIMTPEPSSQTAPASVTATKSEEDADLIPATAAERNQFVRKAVEAERLRLEGQAQELRNQQEMLTRMQSELALSLEKSEARKKAFEEQVAAAGKRKDDESFKSMMALYEELKPKQIKDLFMVMPEEDAARYMTAMEPEKSAKIISEFKTEKEKEFMTGLLDRLRGAAPASGTSAASGSPAAYSAANPAGKVVP